MSYTSTAYNVFPFFFFLGGWFGRVPTHQLGVASDGFLDTDTTFGIDTPSGYEP